jgi:hypothetical protein
MSEELQLKSNAALRTITKARIACTNSIHELELIDGLTDDWNLDNPRLATASLEIHLHAEFSAKEVSTILENLTAIMTAARTVVLQEWLCMELEVRRENAVTATKEIIRVVEILENMEDLENEEMGLVELKRRAEFILVKQEGLKDTLAQLTVDWKAAVEAVEASHSAREDSHVFR